MRFFCYDEPDPVLGNRAFTVTDADIQRDYWPSWHEKMVNRYGKEYVDENLCFLDCLDHWKIINGAWEI